MAFKSFYDTNHDGVLSGFEKSRYEIDNIGYPTHATPDYASELYERELLKNDGFDTSDTDFMYGEPGSRDDDDDTYGAGHDFTFMDVEDDDLEDDEYVTGCDFNFMDDDDSDDYDFDDDEFADDLEDDFDDADDSDDDDSFDDDDY
jgi:hypothetical protein